jgi:hypothetical protein
MHMPKDRPARDVARLPNPSRFLLADESAADYDRLLELYVEDMKPAGALERRQVELILRCDIDIDRQFRLIAEHLNPLGEDVNRGAKAVAEWHREALMHPRARAKYREDDWEPPSAAVEIPDGDACLTPLIARRYAGQRELLTLHQREISHAERRHRQAIELLHRMQDRRRRASVPDAVVIGE